MQNIPRIHVEQSIVESVEEPRDRRGVFEPRCAHPPRELLRFVPDDDRPHGARLDDVFFREGFTRVPYGKHESHHPHV